MTPPKNFKPTFRTGTGRLVSFESATTNDVAAKKRAGLSKAGVPTTPRLAPPPVLAEPERHENNGIPAAPVAILTLELLAVGWAYASHRLGGPVPGSLASALVLYLLVSAIVKPKSRKGK
ncbi:hypothetical protein ACFV6U_09230 [Streptomyces sp. NPDC059810]|uniref:hypothetical protein n=1 Tax=Streptomyces sp. NPDC059810 TaxID=3346956 RepID=UPI0036548C16